MPAHRSPREDLDPPPRDARGGRGRRHERFGERPDALVEELNKELTA